MALYDSLFQMMDMQCSQFLVTSRDFKNDDFKRNLVMTVDNLLAMNVVPVINENDSISSAVRLDLTLLPSILSCPSIPILANDLRMSVYWVAAAQCR